MNRFAKFCAMICLVWCHSLFAAEPIQLTAKFNREEVSWINNPGESAVYGKAFITLKDGTKKGCAGFNIELLPVSDYANERIFNIYGNNQQGQILLEENPPKFTPDSKGYHDMVIKTQCNAQDEFSFAKVSDGNYYVVAFIMWSYGENNAEPNAEPNQGGAVFKRIQLAPKQDMRVDLGGN